MRRFAALALSLLALPALAGQVNLVPSSFVLSSNAGPQALTLSNPGSEKVTYQVSALALTETSDGKVTMTPSHDLLVSPPLLEIQPHSRRTIRIANVRPSATPTYYRLSVREVPPPHDPKKKGMQLLVSYMVPVAYEPANAAPAQLVAHLEADGTLLVSNHGGRRAAINAVGPVDVKPWRAGAMGWVLPGAALRYSFPGVKLTHGQLIQVIDGKQPITLTVE
jgi:fimbrial chaperone protein